MICEYCDNMVPDGAHHCPSCGAAVRSVSPSQVQIQQNANIAAAATLAQAQQAAHGVNAYSQPTGERKSRLAYVLLGLFLGGLGIHNFYVGRTNRAVGQLLTTVLAGWLIIPLFAVCIWVLCDICAITTDGDGIRFQ